MGHLITPTENDFWEGRTDNTPYITSHDINMGYAMKCSCCDEYAMKSNLKKDQHGELFCEECIDNGYAEEHIAGYFDGTIDEFAKHIEHLKSTKFIDMRFRPR